MKIRENIFVYSIWKGFGGGGGSGQGGTSNINCRGSKFLAGNNKLPIVTGRHKNTPRNERKRITSDRQTLSE